MPEGRKIILFGGSFDPIHNGHLAVAMNAFKWLRAERLIFVPARRSPHKRVAPIADGNDRIAMIELAISDHRNFSVSDCELNRREPSYTVDTILHFRSVFGFDDHLYWLVGTDVIQYLDKWYRIDELLKLCRLCIMQRRGVATFDLERFAPTLGPSNVAKLKNDAIPTPLIDIASTGVRTRIANGLPVNDWIPTPVTKYIQTRGLYLSCYCFHYPSISF